MEPIGVASTEFSCLENMPLQGCGISESLGEIKIYDQYSEGLKGLEGFSHAYILFHLHKQSGEALKVTPFLSGTDQPMGIYATRSPKRPNGIGLTISKIQSIEGNIVKLAELDLLDGSPILDIKPYINSFDNVQSHRDGWYEQGKDPQKTLSDDRFIG